MNDTEWKQRQRDWYEQGIREGFCSPNCCSEHDGIPMTAQEADDLFAGEEVCIFSMRLYNDLNHKAECEANSAPANWRKPDAQ